MDEPVQPTVRVDSLWAAPPTLARILANVMRRPDSGNVRIENLTRLSGGASQETWSFDAVPDQGPRDALILRRMPDDTPLNPAAPGPEKEAQVMELAATGGVPVPAVRHVLQPSDGAGRGFVMSRIEGETLARRIIRDAEYAPARAAFAEQAGTILARIHAIDARRAGLAVTSPADEIDQVWTMYRQSDLPRPVLEVAFRWLRENLPAPVVPRLVHADFRNGNLMFGPEGIRAVLDWELMHLGNPIEDLGWLCVNSWRFGEIDKPAGGLASREALVAAYQAASGREVNPAELRFWEVLGTLRWAAICAVKLDWLRHNDHGSVEIGMIARRTSECEIDLLRLLLPEGDDHAG
jgi:aminoglycoside phosphotransferase (APT) family kinase protein